MGKAIFHLLLVLCALYAIYAFFGKAKLNPAAVKSSAVEPKPEDEGMIDSLGCTNPENGSQQAEDMG